MATAQVCRSYLDTSLKEGIGFNTQLNLSRETSQRVYEDESSREIDCLGPLPRSCFTL